MATEKMHVLKHVLMGAVAIALLLTGCVKNYKITQSLTGPLAPQPSVLVGEFRDELPIDMDADKKPPLEDIEKLRRYLAEELIKDEFFSDVSLAEIGGKQYSVTGAIFDYQKGSGVLRALFGVFAGGGHLSTSIELRDRQTGVIMFSGVYKAAVTHYSESGAEMFKRVAKDFTKSLKKNAEKLAQRP